MSKSAAHNIKLYVINTFGSFGYVSCFLQWLWAVILYFSVIKSIALLVTPNSDRQVAHPLGIAFTPPQPLMVIFLALVVVIMIVITIYALISMPKNIVKTSNKIVHKTAKTVAPLVIKTWHYHDTKKRRIIVTSKLVLAIKILLIIIPVALTAVSGFLTDQSLEYSIVLIVGCGLACVSIAFFAIQYILAKLLQIKTAALW